MNNSSSSSYNKAFTRFDEIMRKVIDDPDYNNLTDTFARNTLELSPTEDVTENSEYWDQVSLVSYQLFTRWLSNMYVPQFKED